MRVLSLTDPSVPVLALDNLRVDFSTYDGTVAAVQGVSCPSAGARPWASSASGSGKSQTFMAVMGLLARGGTTSGSTRFQGQEILGLKPRALNRIRGSKMTMIFQDPLTALTPHVRIGEQIAEPCAYIWASRPPAPAPAPACGWIVSASPTRPSAGPVPSRAVWGMRQR